MNFLSNHTEILWTAIIIAGILSHGVKLIIFLKQIIHINNLTHQIKPETNGERFDEEQSLIEVSNDELIKLILKTVRIILLMLFLLGMTFLGGLSWINEFSYELFYKTNYFNLGAEAYQTSITSLTLVAAITSLHLVNHPLSRIAETSRIGFFRTYLYDVLQFLGINLLLTTPIIIFSLFSTYWWAWVLGIAVILRTFRNWIHPNYIKPISYRKYLPEPELTKKIEDLSLKMSFQLSNVLVFDSEQDTKIVEDIKIVGGKNSRLILFPSHFINKFNHDELTYLAAREIGNNYYKNQLFDFFIAIGSILALFYISSLVIDTPWFYEGLNVTPMKDAPILGLYLAAAFLVSLIFLPIVECIQNFISRHRFFKLDKLTTKYCDPRLIFDTELKLNEYHNGNSFYHPIYSKFFNPKPTLDERKQSLNLNSTDLIL